MVGAGSGNTEVSVVGVDREIRLLDGGDNSADSAVRDSIADGRVVCRVAYAVFKVAVANNVCRVNGIRRPLQNIATFGA